MQELAADRVEIDLLQLRRQVLGRRLVDVGLAAGLDVPGPRGRGVEPLLKRGAAALVPQRLAVEADRFELVPVAVGVARAAARIGIDLADIRGEPLADPGAGDLAHLRPGRDGLGQLDRELIVAGDHAKCLRSWAPTPSTIPRPSSIRGGANPS